MIAFPQAAMAQQIGTATTTATAATSGGFWSDLTTTVGDWGNKALDLAQAAAPGFVAYKTIREQRNDALGRRRKRRKNRDKGGLDGTTLALIGGGALLLVLVAKE